jgi:1-acyl-sn-glycerol-3-phosphate acyltransferase
VAVTGKDDAAVEEAMARSRAAIASVGEGYLELT